MSLFFLLNPKQFGKKLAGGRNVISYDDTHGYFDITVARDSIAKEPFEFLNDVFGKKWPNLLKLFGKDYMLKMRLLLLAICMDDDDD